MNKREYYYTNRERFLEKKKEELNTIEGRAKNLLRCYEKEDKKNNRGKGNLTTEWLIDNILSKPCSHCGKEGWKVIGCNRLDNTKPHTIYNVEPCCVECNREMWGKEASKKVYQYTLDGKLVKEWESATECGKNGYNRCSVRDCCKGGRYSPQKKKWVNIVQHKGYKWSYEPL